MKSGKLKEKLLKVTGIFIAISLFSSSIVVGAAEKAGNGKLDQNLQEVMKISDEDESDTRPVLEPEAEEILRQDYLQMLKEKSPNNTGVQGMELSDIVILQYCGTYDGSEVVLMSAKDWMDTTDIKEVSIGKFVFAFAFGSQAERFYLHKDHKFIPVADAYENKLLGDEELASVAKLFNDGNHAYEKQMEYEDVKETDWFYPYVSELWQNGIMTGIDDKTFAPSAPLARAQFMVILYRMEGSPEMTIFPEKAWADVGNDWYTNAIYWGFLHKIMTGYSNSDYWGTADSITREQLATVMYRYADYKEYDITKRAEIDQFEDAASVSDFAKDAVQWAVAEGIIEGKENGTRLDPQGTTTRAEGAAVIQRVLEKYKK